MKGKHSIKSKIALKDPQNYEARSNIMWIATWTLNTLVAKGKLQTGWYKILSKEEIVQILKSH